MKITNIATAIVLSVFGLSVLASSPVSWTAPIPDSQSTTGGLDVLDGTTDYLIYEVGTTLGTYNHGANISRANGILFVSWSSHDGFEGAAGTRILYSMSTDGGQTWSSTDVLFDSIGTMADPPATGTSLNARGVETLNGRMYAISSVYEISGWVDGSAQSSMLGLIAVALDEQGEPASPAFWLRDDAPAGYTSMPDWTTLDGQTYPYAVDDTKAINGGLSDFWHYKATYNITAEDEASLVEPTFYTCNDGKQVTLFRSNGSLELYAAIRDDYNSAWSQAVPSSIPDSESLNDSIVLPDGSVILTGNNVPELWYRDLLVISRSIDGYDFDRAWALRYDPPAIEYKQTGDHKGTGFQYPSSIVNGDNVWVAYSINKESIGATKIPIDRIMRPVGDLTEDDAVDLYDFIEIANYLDECGDPADPNCLQF
jgi:hypothetical protein